MLNFAETLEQLNNRKCALCGKKSIWALMKDNICLACKTDLEERGEYDRPYK